MCTDRKRVSVSSQAPRPCTIAILTFLMPTSLPGQQHFDSAVAPLCDAMRTPGQNVHATPMAVLKLQDKG